MNQPSWFIRGSQSHLENSGRFLSQLVAPPPIGWLEDLLILNQHCWHMLTYVDPCWPLESYPSKKFMWHPMTRLFQLETLRLCLHRFGLHLSAVTGQAAFVVLYLQHNSYGRWHDFWKEKPVHNCLPARDVEVCFIVLFSNWKRTSGMLVWCFF